MPYNMYRSSFTWTTTSFPWIDLNSLNGEEQLVELVKDGAFKPTNVAKNIPNVLEELKNSSKSFDTEQTKIIERFVVEAF